MDKNFDYKDQQFILRVWGFPYDFYGSATRKGGKMLTRLYKPSQTAEAAFTALEQRVREILDAHYWTWANGKVLVGSIREIRGNYFIRLALIDRYIDRRDVELKHYQADRLETAQLMLDNKAAEIAKEYGKILKPCPPPDFITLP